MAGKMTWYHLRDIVHISSEEENNYYLNEVADENWSVIASERNIKSGYYMRMLSAQLTERENKALEFVKESFLLGMGKVPTIEKLRKELERNQ